jgi:hypothetical protein
VSISIKESTAARNVLALNGFSGHHFEVGTEQDTAVTDVSKLDAVPKRNFARRGRRPLNTTLRSLSRAPPRSVDSERRLVLEQRFDDALDQAWSQVAWFPWELASGFDGLLAADEDQVPFRQQPSFGGCFDAALPFVALVR